MMASATVRDLRTQFPRIRRVLEREGEVLITHRGRPVVVLRAYAEPRPAKARRVDYYARLRRRMPRPLRAAVRRALDEADRDER
jgi:antitoxin (DNA-binding transcriptional repressor) of toxin-antitoxin stability system